MVVLAASICTRGGKAVLSRQFREIARSRIEGLLASFPKLADSGTQHTTVEQDNVRYVYQPLDELYMVLITNRQSNILQDIDSLHLFAQVVTSICKSLDEREILRNAYELLSAFDELVTLGYRENLSIGQIKTFLEMESHEERIQEIISRNKELEATEERKRKAKQLELQRKEMARSGRAAAPRTPSYPTYTPVRPAVPDTYDSYEAEKNKTFKASTSKGKGMQLGKKSKTTDMFERVKVDLGPQAEESAPLVPSSLSTVTAQDAQSDGTSHDSEAIRITIAESISARFSREGFLQSYDVKGDLQLRISDPSLTQLKLELIAIATNGTQFFRVHPKVDKALFDESRVIQLSDVSTSFPTNNSLSILRWHAKGPSKVSLAQGTDGGELLPIKFAVWIIRGDDEENTITVEYELVGESHLQDVVLTIPYSTSEPAVQSLDATYEVSGGSLKWTIGSVDESNATGTFEFVAQSDDDEEFFPMKVGFKKSEPFVNVDVSSVILVHGHEDLPFAKAIKSVADSYLIE